MKKKIKQSLICKNIQRFEISSELVTKHTPNAGDVGIFRVLTDTSAYIMDTKGVATKIFSGDLLMLAFGNRYATNQFEGYVPDRPVTVCQLLGRGGVAGLLKSQNATFSQIPVTIELVGYATNEVGRVLNTVRSEELDTFAARPMRTKVVLSVGSSMDSGKTTSAAYLCRGLSLSGKRVAYLKLTGTVFPKDAQLNLDLGADYANDFSCFGLPSTYMCSEKLLLDLYQSLLNLASEAIDPNYVVVEIADGLLQRETMMLLKNTAFMRTVHAVMLSCGDSLGVLSGLQMLKNWDCAPFAVSGLFTASDLLVQEVRSVVDVPILNLKELSNCKGVELLENRQKAGTVVLQPEPLLEAA